MADDPPFDVVVVVTSAGGLDALTTVLRAIGPASPAPVVVAQHLSGQGSMLVEILQRRTQLSIEWAVDGSSLDPGSIVVCPPRQLLELRPDRTVRLTPSPSEHGGHPFDSLLGSLAENYGARGLAVVLTGMGYDAAAGAADVHERGGTVIVQDPSTAEYAGMPKAAIETGAGDLVLPLEEVGKIVHELVHSGRHPARHQGPAELLP
jgi:two-component system chemotaxis response regulator CheB